MGRKYNYHISIKYKGVVLVDANVSTSTPYHEIIYLVNSSKLSRRGRAGRIIKDKIIRKALGTLKEASIWFSVSCGFERSLHSTNKDIEVDVTINKGWSYFY